MSNALLLFIFIFFTKIMKGCICNFWIWICRPLRNNRKIPGIMTLQKHVGKKKLDLKISCSFARHNILIKRTSKRIFIARVGKYTRFKIHIIKLRLDPRVFSAVNFYYEIYEKSPNLSLWSSINWSSRRRMNYGALSEKCSSPRGEIRN